MKYIAMLVMMTLFAAGGYGMIETLSLDSLVQSADVIAMVEVVGVKSVGRLPSEIEVIANLVTVDEPLKGGVAVGEKLKIKTYRGIEDNPDLVEGSRVLIFLNRADNHYIFTNAIQGWWPVGEDGKFMAMGKGTSLDDVKEAIKRPPQPKPAAPDISL
ncbi:MAG: hypothetical protein CVV41_22660 [Candidatus Riflebacteria bacterium HGW-Riflebacteria-1]|jgi:hypothetical protein|nr:MAG: hypothetical protein CVV41_22660 [Candidatus Riflebacteria bacterium HGW-Riflebacteria-1]